MKSVSTAITTQNLAFELRVAVLALAPARRRARSRRYARSIASGSSDGASSSSAGDAGRADVGWADGLVRALGHTSSSLSDTYAGDGGRNLFCAAETPELDRARHRRNACMNLHRAGRPLVIGHRGAAARGTREHARRARRGGGRRRRPRRVRRDRRAVAWPLAGRDPGRPGLARRRSRVPRRPGGRGACRRQARRDRAGRRRRAAAARADGPAVSSTAVSKSVRRLARGRARAARGRSPTRTTATALPGCRWPRSVTARGAAALRAVMPVRVPLLLAQTRANVLALHHALVSPAVVRHACPRRARPRVDRERSGARRAPRRGRRRRDRDR